jgi:hypothetical protein
MNPESEVMTYLGNLHLIGFHVCLSLCYQISYVVSV